MIFFKKKMANPTQGQMKALILMVLGNMTGNVIGKGNKM
jgi:uncharacterized protein YejL (UPF0352 family)